jgi:uncharacterized protein (TIGR03083 family)
VTSSEADLLDLLAASFVGLADALAGVEQSRWSERSMCEGWTVAHVIAHLTMASRYDESAFTAELTADGFDFQTMSDRIAERDGALPPAALIENLRSDTMARFATPGGGLEGSLSHVVIHGLDATWPLGIGRTAPDDAAVLVLDGLVTASPNVFGVEIEGLELHADDVDWSHGRGRPVAKPAGELILALAGRDVTL